MSRTVNLAFTPTLNHLRAYLAAYAAPQGLGEHDITFDKPASRPPILAVINALQLHTSSGELSAQGLSRTLALALATAVRSDMRLVVGDSPTTAEFDTDDSESQSGTAPLRDQWTQQVPLLSGSIRFGGDQRVWAGRTIEARRVAGRWCQFTKLEELQNEG
ncbi:hypothetical protein MMC19_003436 [Ptychographa xylographoides]|nr:hypothetical protein [Ptychographa xylographoides]